ncbi:MAG: icmQ [Gammaproteobacteria bacterium]|jgi:Dot/Icm secretion system protein IcmQ|nr:icmQ [Gammaproteobacteria bacterium]
MKFLNPVKRKMASPEELQELLTKFHETLEKWPRDGGLFLDLMKEKLKKLEQTFANEVAGQIPSSLVDKQKAFASTDMSGQKEVYVALYQMHGDNLDKWVTTLHSIAMQGISRPIYENEADVCSMIRTKLQRSKEAYAVVKVLASDIVKTPNEPTDRDGRKLLHIKPGSLKPENIVRFVHISGQYLWQNGKLTKLDLASPIISK